MITVQGIEFVFCFGAWLTILMLALQYSTLPRDYWEAKENNRIVPVYNNPGEDSEIVLDPIEGDNDDED